MLIYNQFQFFCVRQKEKFPDLAFMNLFDGAVGFLMSKQKININDELL